MQEKSERAGDQAGSLASGTQLGPYRVDAYIGAGGMGEVFRATDTRLRRCVAVKLLPLKRAVDPLSQQRFLQEARAASALNHPNIVSIHDISTHHGRDFIVMEFVEGQTLRNLIGEEGLPIPQITNLGVQIASALNAAHSAGIVHRDIKPDNIMVTSGQVAKILDFGIAKTIWRTAPASDETGTFTDFQAEAGVVGTVAYMSPEQARGETVDGRSDIFSLGSLLYEAATGKLPFTGKNVLSVMHEIGTVTPAAPSKLRPEIPSAFDHLITRCLEKDPARRPSRASEIAEALQSLAVPSRITSIEPTASRRVVAVVPFQFHGASQEDRSLSVALAESVANRLGSSATLVIRPTSSLVKYSGQIIDGAQIARETNVDIVVEGSIQKLGTRVRVLVQVLEHRDLQTLYSGKLDGDMADLFAVQDRLADSVYDALTPHAPRKPVRTEPPHARHPLAFELYMRATEKTVCFAKFEVGAIIEMLEKAVELDPNFADAWGMLSTTCWQMGAHIDPDPKWFSRAEQAISRTLELDPVNCDAFCARGMIHFSASRGFQLAPALRALNASLKINPGRALARAQRGGILFHIGFHEAALENFDECIFANPDMALGYAARSQTEIFMGNYAKAEDLMQRALALEPTLVQAHISVPLPMICQGNLGKAWEKLRKSKQMIPEEPQIASLEGLILACEGNFSRAEQLADQAVASARSMVHSHHTWHVAAGVYAVCGKPEKAIAELKRCSQNGLPNYRAFEADPHLRSLHSHPDFVALMRDLRRGYESLREEFDVREVYVPRHTTSPR